MWQKPERLTSGTRDANLPAVDCAAGAGCMLTWQEDPDGLRPGLGLGPGEGWSGAVAWQQTDIWYSHISQAEFDLVFSAEDVGIGAIPMSEYALLTDATMPKPYVPMAMPVRLTDNAMCKADKQRSLLLHRLRQHRRHRSAGAAHRPHRQILTSAPPRYPGLNPGGTTLNLCVTEDNRLLNGRVASTRVRMNLKPYTPGGRHGTRAPGSSWRPKSPRRLGDTAEDEDADPIDIGKDMWYYSFDPFKTGADEFMVNAGRLAQPARRLQGRDGCVLHRGVDEFYDIQVDDRGFEYYLTEIARRFALTTNSVNGSCQLRERPVCHADLQAGHHQPGRPGRHHAAPHADR